MSGGLCKRVIPCLDVRDGRVVKGVQFQSLRDAGSPLECARRYENDGADELIMLDIVASEEGRATRLELVRALRGILRIPLTVGGGVQSLDDGWRLLDAGADKISVNAAALMRPALVGEMASRFGSQCTVVAVDARQKTSSSWEAYLMGGKKASGRDVKSWCGEVVARGAGEILLTSWDRDGTRSGYDLDLLREICTSVKVPVVASGGAHSASSLADAARAGASGLLAASLFHDGQCSVGDVKRELRQMGIEVRL